MDLLKWLEMLDELVSKSFQIPLSGWVVIKEDDLYNISRQIRMSLPDEVKAAQDVVMHGDKIRKEAEEKSRLILKDVEQRAKELVSEHVLVQQAREQANTMMQEAQTQAQNLREESERYAFLVLDRLERQLQALAETVRQGKEALQQNQKPR